MATKRFSKDTLREHIQRRMDSIQKVYGFDYDNGSAQIGSVARNANEDGYKTSIEYGKFRELCSLAQELSINISIAPNGYELRQIPGCCRRWVKPE